MLVHIFCLWNYYSFEKLQYQILVNYTSECGHTGLLTEPTSFLDDSDLINPIGYSRVNANNKWNGTLTSITGNTLLYCNNVLTLALCNFEFHWSRNRSADDVTACFVLTSNNHGRDLAPTKIHIPECNAFSSILNFAVIPVIILSLLISTFSLWTWKIQLLLMLSPKKSMISEPRNPPEHRLYSHGNKKKISWQTKHLRPKQKRKKKEKKIRPWPAVKLLFFSTCSQWNSLDGR